MQERKILKSRHYLWQSYSKIETKKVPKLFLRIVAV
jgi:hypothetical protein